MQSQSASIYKKQQNHYLESKIINVNLINYLRETEIGVE